MQIKTFVLLMVFIGGAFLVMIGLLGSATADCPRPVTQFPLPELHCSVLTGLAFVGLVVMMAGGLGFAGMRMYDVIRTERI